MATERKPEAGAQQSGWQNLGLVIDFWRQRKLLAVLLVAATAGMTAISLAFPYILRFIIDGIKRGVTEGELVRYVLLLAGLGFLRSVAEAVVPWTRGRISERYQWVVRARVFRRLLDKGHSFTNRFPTGDVMERLDHDLHELSWFACSGIFRTVSALFSVIFALVFMLSMNPLLTLATMLPVGAAAFVWAKLGPLVFSRYMAWRRKISAINTLLESAFAGIRLVKSYTMENRLGGTFRKTLNERVDASVETTRVESRIDVFYMAVAEIGILMVLWLGGFLVVKGQLSLGEFVAFNGYVLMLVGPMFDIGNFFVTGRRAQVGSERVGEMEAHRTEVAPPESCGHQVSPGDLRLENVTFAYDGTKDRSKETVGSPASRRDSPARPVLKNVTMDFPKGSRVGIAGTVGSGKSSILHLLFRLADPQTGKVLLGGADIRSLDLEGYRALFGYAPQEATLFSDSLRENIAFGQDADAAELKRVISLAQLEEDLKGFGSGMDEKLGGRGARLSGGQKERVAIARALVDRPPVLVFDDATSALDAETEKELIRRLEKEQGSATVIIISHRLSILSGCDRVYVFDAGEVKEEGTHEELLARRGLYWKLYERQLMKEELEKL